MTILSLVSEWPAESISQTSSKYDLLFFINRCIKYSYNNIYIIYSLSLVNAFEGITKNLVTQESFKEIHFSEENLDFLAQKVFS